VESEPGRGATFIVHLPTDQDATTEPEECEASERREW
jgi:hypothetical protein